MERDRKHDELLRAAGWEVVRYWEREILADPERIALAIAERVRAKRSQP
ncbi:MAG: DUF559 domain-containing protein [Polyangiaceae bacterium]